MTLEPGFEQALLSADPAAELRSLAERLASQGYDRSAILSKFDDVRRQLREADREGDEDVVLGVMDCLVGWCSPGSELPSHAGGTNGSPPASPETPVPTPRTEP